MQFDQDKRKISGKSKNRCFIAHTLYLYFPQCRDQHRHLGHDAANLPLIYAGQVRTGIYYRIGRVSCNTLTVRGEHVYMNEIMYRMRVGFFIYIDFKSNYFLREQFHWFCYMFNIESGDIYVLVCFFNSF